MSMTLDIDVVADSGDYQQIIEEDTLDEPIKEDETVVEFDVVKHEEALDKVTKPKQTSPFLTKYERARLLGIRTQQLNRNAIPTVKVGKLRDTKEIAKKELLDRTMPLKVRRYLPNNTYEDWSLEELIY